MTAQAPSWFRLRLALAAIASVLMFASTPSAPASGKSISGLVNKGPESAAKAKESTQETDDDSAGFLSGPGRTLRAFLTAMESEPRNYDRATACMEVSGRSKNSAVNRARADQLHWSLIHLAYSDISNQGVPNTLAQGDRFSLLPAPSDASELTLQRSSQILDFSEGQAQITLAKSEHGAWRFDEATVGDDNIGHLSNADQKLIEADSSVRDEVESASFKGWLLVNMPKSLQGKFLFVAYWQWISLAVLIFIGFLVDVIFRLFFRLILRRWIAKVLKHVGGTSPNESIKKTGRSTGFLIATIIWRLGLDLLYLPVGIYEMLTVGANILIVIAAVFTAFRATDLLGIVFSHRAARTDNKLDDLLVPLVRKTVKFVIVIIGFVYFADVINIEISPLLAGIGIGGIGFAFAAQNSIENFFGSVTVLLDRPFQVGDWVVIGDVEGTVASVGMRSTRVRTFYDSMVTLPNSVLVNTTVNNYGMRSYRRWSTKMDLLYETRPEQVDAYCEGVRELVRNHPFMRRENYQVYLNEFGESGIQILIYVFWQVPDWSTELRERHRFMLDLMRLAESLGVSFAYPTQTLYLARSPAISKTPDSLVSGQEQTVNEKSGRAAARLLIESADWLSRKPEPHLYLDAEHSKAIDEGRAGATPDRADAPKTRGDAGEGA